eukprot:TRINITY_DN7564_c0_g1_i1.p1 TRINITY_DN7564_c0_g1~~TRINITY_DN7564_c0_g1_i1.p1  ORF type:complete len:196 (-),score=45.27 TRINITY_DN7564_c0_g1_i1:233-751(-)
MAPPRRDGRSSFLRRGAINAVLAVAIACSLQAVAAAGADPAAPLLEKSINATTKLSHTVAKVMHRSTEEVKSIKSLLTTNAKATGAMNDLLLTLESLTARMERFGGAMEACRREVSMLEAQGSRVLTPQEVDDPLLGTSSLLQLKHHAMTLSHQVHAVVARATAKRFNATRL